MTTWVRVERNRYGKPDQPWIVRCSVCAGGPRGTFFDLFTGADIKGWARDWRTAQDYAIQHALDHEATRCHTCLHVPTKPLPHEQEVSR